jgi:fumarate hydratase subunit alpha
MKTIEAAAISSAVRELAIRANIVLGQDVRESLGRGLAAEESPLGREILQTILTNADVALRENLPICQDTGVAVFFVEIGTGVAITGGTLQSAIDEGVRRGYAEGYLRKSLVADPIRRANTGDNTPAIIHCRQVEGDALRIVIAPKGGGSENMSALAMLKPSQGIEGLKAFVKSTVENGAANACAPVIVGVGVGGNFEVAPLLAKKALLRKVGSPHPDEFWAAMEAELLEMVNATGIGPMGLGGRITALAVHIEVHPCHIASLPVAVNLNCHAHRHEEVVL